jgi:hypothetical protein
MPRPLEQVERSCGGYLNDRDRCDPVGRRASIVVMTNQAPALHDVLTEHGAAWQIVHDAEAAVNQPTLTALHFTCEHDLASLAVKLAATGDRGTG